MTWLAWRVQRDQYLVAAVGVVAVAAWLVAGGLVPAAGWAVGSAHGLAVVLFLLPGALGAALGAPLVGSEAEHGTQRLAFTQTTGRTTWLLRKLAVTGAVIAVLTAALSVLARWWLHAGHGAGPLLMSPKDFGITGPVVVASALFGFGLGVLFGTLVHNAGWAFALGAPIAIVGRLVVGAGRSTFSSPTEVVDPSLNPGWPPPGQPIHEAIFRWGTSRLRQVTAGPWHSASRLRRCTRAPVTCRDRALAERKAWPAARGRRTCTS